MVLKKEKRESERSVNWWTGKRKAAKGENAHGQEELLNIHEWRCVSKVGHQKKRLMKEKEMEVIQIKKKRCI